MVMRFPLESIPCITEDRKSPLWYGDSWILYYDVCLAEYMSVNDWNNKQY